jgi:ribonuclease D
MHIRNEIPPKFPNNTYIAIDTEHFRQQTGKLHRPHGKFAIMTFCTMPDFVWYITDPAEISIALKTLDNCVWVIQNAKYDLTQLKPYTVIPPRTRLIDTMLIERILWNGYYDSFSEDSMARRYLNIEMSDKDYWQKWFSEHDELTPGAIEYSCNDTNILIQIWNEQKKLLTKTDMKIWREIDQPALWAVLDFQGFRIDPEAWTNLAESNKEKVKEIDADIEINPRSNPQVLKLLRNLGFTNLQNTQEKSLQKAIRKYPRQQKQSKKQQRF